MPLRGALVSGMLSRSGMGNYSFEQYRRRVDALEYRGKRRDMPRDVSRLLELAQAIELEERIILDRTDNVSY